MTQTKPIFKELLLERLSHVCDLLRWQPNKQGLSGVCVKNKDITEINAKAYNVYNRSVVIRKNFLKVNYYWFTFMRNKFPIITSVGRSDNQTYDLNKPEDCEKWVN